MSEVYDIYNSGKKQEVYLSPTDAMNERSKYFELCNKIIQHIADNPEKYGYHELKDLQKIIPPEPIFKIKATSKKYKLDKNDWDKCDSIDKLSTLTVTELKDILSLNCKPISGKKDILINRVLSINFPSLAKPETKKKTKKGRPKKKSNNLMEIFDLQSAIETGKTVYLEKKDDKLHVSYLKNEKNKYILIDNKNWIFNEDEVGYSFVGILNDNIVHECEPPDELLKLYEE